MLKNLNDDQKTNMAFIGSRLKGTIHNINTPLSSIVGRSEMLMMRIKKMKDMLNSNIEIEEFDKCLRDASLIMESSNRISEIIKNVMQKSINAESCDLQKLNIAKILINELEFLSSDMDFKHNIEKIYNISENIHAIDGLYVHFSNSFLEILENCKAAMLKTNEKKLTVTLTESKEYIEIKFHDTGCGIEQNKAGQLLSVLHNPSSLLTDNDLIGGGIAKVGRLLKQYNPCFDIQSVPGDTTFIVKLPCK